MATQLEIFWLNVREEAARIRTAVSNSVYQPKDGSCLLVSLEGPPGRISEAIIDGRNQAGTAGYCIVSKTHRLATSEECQSYFEQVAARQADRAAGASVKRTNVL